MRKFAYRLIRKYLTIAHVLDLTHSVVCNPKTNKNVQPNQWLRNLVLVMLQKNEDGLSRSYINLYVKTTNI